MAAVILMMMAATVIEKTSGSSLAFRLFYHSPLFIAFWVAAVVSGTMYIIAMKMHRKPMTLLLHVAFVVILAGALVTHVFGDTGQVHLREGESNAVMYHRDGSVRELPFELTLADFEVERYSGSMAASDYRSSVEISDGARMDISMNKIGKHRGYRFYQANYDEDGRGSVLSVTYDPWGVGITYTGYLLLMAALLGFFFQKDTQFRRTLRRLASVIVVLVGLPFAASAGNPELPAIPKGVADEFSQLYVYYNDRVAPFQTLARDYCLKAYGDASYEGLTAEQVVTGWLFYYDWWSAVPFKLKAKDKGTSKEMEKEEIRMSVASGDAFKIFPIAFADSIRTLNPGLPEVVWFSSNDPLPEDIDQNLWTFVRRSLDLVNDEVRNGDWDEVSRIVGQIRRYQEKTASGFLPSPTHVKAERFYNRISRPKIPFMASVTLGLILFILAGFRLSKGRKAPTAEQNVLAVVSGTMFLYLTLVLGLRWYVSGHAPFAGSYSVMMLMAWLASLAMTLGYRKFDLVQPLGFILAGFTMLVASLASANPQITHLMPVLQSPLLSIHVLSMMISYTLFGIVALNGVMGLCVSGDACERLRDVSLVILYPALFLLTFGIFLGAVWANVSWGSYWAWDPKETWALVTMLIYSAAVHGTSIKAFRNPKFFHAFCIIAFLSVLITYFGVNMLLGGMHAYA